MSVEPRDHSPFMPRSPSSNMAIQVAVLTQKLEQAEQHIEQLKKREEASKKAYAMLLNAFNDINGNGTEVLIVNSSITYRKVLKTR
jgi:predicted RNase H-like nuclease (RuvC/YqgF family)